ncbi:MAG TPA: MFS transporter [Nitrospira sp.]|nr:MFS transporter [Nitrospira sp.]
MSLSDSVEQDVREPSRRYGLRDGACQAITQGSGEQYLSAFALLLGANPFQLSVLSALPQLIGTGAQLASVKLLRWFPDRKALIRAGTAGQALTWVPILLLPLLFPAAGPWLLIFGTALYFACNQFTTPTWNSFIADHLDEHERGAYFARRATIMASLSFAALCLAGWLLTVWQDETFAWIGFALIFAVAGVARWISALAVANVDDIHATPFLDSSPSFRQFLARTSISFRRFLLFSGAMHAAVLIAAPFFVLYMLRDLRLAYWGYGTWLAAGILGQLITLKAWGRFGDRFGNKALLTVTGFMVPFLPMLYLAGTDLLFLLLVNFLGGVTWGGLALGLQNYVFDAVRPEDRAKAVATYSTINALGWCLGAFLGSWLVNALPARITIGQFSLEPVSNLPFVFFASGVLRLAVSGSFLRTFHEARVVESAAFGQLVWELPLLKSVAQFLDSPIRLSK